MHYLGGKSRTCCTIGGYLNTIRQPGQPYWEPFVGAGWVLQKIIGGERYASDANSALIFMWQKLQQGWQPPSEVTEGEYQAALAGCYPAHLTAFINFGCSFGGKWAAGYARGEDGRNYASNAKNSLVDKTAKVADVHFFAADFLTCYPPAQNCLIYCDPPYSQTSDYDAVGPFDTAAFWERVRWLEARGHTVVVSEYAAPADFSCVVRMPTKTDLHTNNGKELRIERLFQLGDHAPLQPELF